MVGSSSKKPQSNARRITGNVLIGLAAAYTLYLIAVMMYKTSVIVEKASYMGVFAFEMVICVFLMIGAFDIRFGFLTAAGRKGLRIPGWIVRILTAAIVTVVLVLFVVIVTNSFIKDAPPVKNVIVLGMALENGRPNSDLIKRVEAAAGYAKENPEAVLIVTGGNKGESGETEADVMRRLLTEQGISGERIINEDEAVNTVENFANVAKKTGTNEPVLIVTSGYHMLRACGIAGKTGFSDIKRLPASSGVLFWPANVTWEIICEINSIIH